MRGTGENTDILSVQAVLVRVADQLKKAKSRTDDPEKIKAINHELIEVNHRITMTGALIFHKRTIKITEAARKVKDARVEVELEIKRVDKINSFIKKISAFLALVDKVIDLAKLVI
ncbi:hypothetical protein H4W19_14715 [Pseudoxanthomonas mexicana]|uniref:Uncharacterized protein n=1 Tax=Pseudoxanthomonas mexicana TaxID=128785 RepID=A0ABX6R8J3_PSEMX|nr:hypothetical protein [Pseudoxanthomonas mexicana]QND79583.1 hypothetical protein H4W19_14715 [Pseudoxanthomonas mexicana]WBX93142.1 hypothetical protein PE064_15870 [Pseudoxanthomonas mexicana]